MRLALVVILVAGCARGYGPEKPTYPSGPRPVDPSEPGLSGSPLTFPAEQERKTRNANEERRRRCVKREKRRLLEDIDDPAPEAKLIITARAIARCGEQGIEPTPDEICESRERDDGVVETRCWRP
jgi:hypothetical protein